MFEFLDLISRIFNPAGPDPELERQKERIDSVFARQLAHQHAVARTKRKVRVRKLKQMLEWIRAHRLDIQAALREDFGKPETETDLSEILVVTSELRHAIKHLREWMEPRKVDGTILFPTASAWIEYEPRGVVLIVSPWNFPFNLTVGPLVSAVAAGNCVMIKPSEYTPATSRLVGKMIAEIFPEEEVAMFEGDSRTATLLLDKPFHHIFFTGSPAVGRIVQQAAAKHLSTVTLELGGKSPVIVDQKVNLRDAAKKIAWGKFMNNGQTCVAPDYALVHRDRYAEFIEELKTVIQEFYGDSHEAQKQTPHYARIISKRHHGRLHDLVEKALAQGARLEAGGQVDHEENYLSPTVLSGVPLDSPIMNEEIFGPVLPVLPVDSLEEAVSIIRSKEKPLALYVFSKRSKSIRYVLSETTAGGTCINDTVIHFLHPHLPFGGVNFSGSGNSHGLYGFRAFSHERSILKYHRFSPMKLLYPPYNHFGKRVAGFLARYF